MRKIFSAADIKGCMEKVQSVKYAEEACYNGSLTIKALSSGLEIGACNWNILSPRGSISYLSGSVFASTTATGFDYKALEGSDILLYSDFTDCNDVDSEKNNFPLATGCSYSSDIGSCSETIIESWIDSSEYTREMETVSSICSCALETISDGGSVLIAIGQPGVMLQLLEDMSLSLESSNLKVPIYLVSSVAEELLAFSNIIPECLSSQRQERFYSKPGPLFTHVQLSNEKKLLVSPAIHSSKFLTSWQEPCIVFCPHWSLRLGPVVHLLQRWCQDPNSLLLMEEGYDINLAFLPFKPMSMKYGLCSFISGMKLRKVIPLLKILQPKHVLVPESLRPHISCCNPNFSVRYFSENETVIMPKLKSYADMDIAMDSDSKEKEEQYIAKLKGELLVEQGKHRLVLENKLVLSLQVKGRVDLDSLLTALQKMGMKVTAEHAQSTDGPENVSIVYISEPKEALIEITPTRTMISVADETTSSLVSEAVRSTLVSFEYPEEVGLINFDPGNVAAAVSGVAEEEDKEDDKWRIRVEEGAPHGVRVVAAPHSLKSLVPVREPVVIGDGGGGGRVDGVVKVSSLALYSDVYGELVGVEKKASVVCESCKVQCASGYYEYSKVQCAI
ncbi:hypothetical protein CQW23_07969 [Capsicum baccatum]|uniref:Beta-Casp domain-containing protein n=1 Tax=Capsicum baccatum TaxID=33114 RepID=A0A2G2X7P7_CAPBA|nr:hypothetical protein CQW23_07969 [Capsicum baccatum]